MKKSKRWRKDLNQLRAMADVPWPARRFRYPPTGGKQLTDARCPNIVAVRRRRRPGWRGLVDLLRRRLPVEQKIACGTPLLLVPHSSLRRGHLTCIRCGPIRRRR